jgi:predicted molibdopterin-dependent oxidoreductase YjgC
MSESTYWFQPPPRPSKIPLPPEEPHIPPIEISIDGSKVVVPAGATILDACKKVGLDTPTICYHDTLTPVNVCRVCVVELDGSRTLVPSCSRKAETGMVIKTDSERVRHSRKMVLEFLQSSVDLSTAPQIVKQAERYGANSARYGESATPAAANERDHRHAGHHELPPGDRAQTVAQPPKIDNDLYVRDYAKCLLCYKCVEACGTDAQNTFAIAVAGRGFDGRISTEFNNPLPDSACVYCGNCIGVCPTGALSFKSEFDMRKEGTWDESKQTKTDTICSFCGVGCTLSLHVQDNRIVKVMSPGEQEITRGNLCIKGRFGYSHVQNEPDKDALTR